jgi:ABC-2 type transport system permease protein
MFGPSLKLPHLVQDLSPFTHSPQAPAVDVTAGPVLTLTAIAVSLAVVGVLVLRRRNLALPA